MTRVAFYAPLKSPRHPNPSGDRGMARNLLSMLDHAGCSAVLASELRSHDKHGSAGLQDALMVQAEQEAQKLIKDLPPVDLWLTYHNYYKAPDLIGPTVCAARGIPYVQIESTRALKRLNGDWDRFARAAHDACDAASLVFYLTGQDRFALERDKPAYQHLARLSPFLPRTDLPPSSEGGGPILVAAMMRDGDKLASYRLVAETLAGAKSDWRLNIAGDGPARFAVEELMAPFGDRVHFLGLCDAEAMARAYAGSCMLLWPGVNEAFGMVYLEAQAAGLPVVAQDRPGVRDVLAPGTYPAVADGPEALAQLLDAYWSDPTKRSDSAQGARDYVRENHLMSAAAKQFLHAIEPILECKQ